MRIKRGVQRALYCGCGADTILAQGLCATCYTRRRQDEAHFGCFALLQRPGLFGVCWMRLRLSRAV